MRRTAIIAVTGWLAATAAATVAGVAAVTMIGRGLAGPGADEPRSQEEIAAALATASPGGPGSTTAPPASAELGPASVPASPTATVSTKGTSQVLRTPGGSVLARCAGGRVTLEWWSPAQGYAVGEARPGPAHEAKVSFERGEDEIEAEVTCVAGTPRLKWKRD